MTRTLFFTIGCEHEGADIRTYVRKALGLSARVLTALKYEGEILLNGTPARSTERVSAGDVLSLTLFDDVCEYEPVDMSLNVLYEDEDFLVIHKNAGMPVHPSPGHDSDSVLNAAAHYFRNSENFVFRPLYRLDRDTIGALVLAKNKFAASAQLTKTYTAVCEGEVPEEGRIDTPIGLLPGHSVQRGTGFGQPAVTEFIRISTDGSHSLVRFNLLTGRTHQIRVHMSGIGHPIAGDDMYGGHLDIVKNQMLCCSKIHIKCPVLRLDITVETDFSDEVKNRFSKLW